MVFGAGGREGGSGVSTRGWTGDILTDDHDYKLRGLTELRTDQSQIYENVLLSGQPLT